MTTEITGIALAVSAGLALGAVFFGGLWWTVRRGLSSDLAGLWFTGSFFVRTAIVLTGFYFAAHSDWRRMAGCLAGFLCARLIVVRCTRLAEDA
jgi:F1F0 ATPase subunit 2